VRRAAALSQLMHERTLACIRKLTHARYAVKHYTKVGGDVAYFELVGAIELGVGALVDYFSHHLYESVYRRSVCEECM
jgi:hypothetical protein